MHRLMMDLWIPILISMVVILAAAILVPVADRKDRGLAVLLFGLLCLALPLVGAALTLAYAVTLRSIAHRMGEAETEPIVVPPPVRDFRLRPTQVAPGAIAARLQGAEDSQQRLGALSLITSSRFAEQLRLLRHALQDEAEEVRLLAYAALDQREQENTEILIDLQRQIARCPPGPVSQRLRDYLAWLHWNIDHSVSQELADPRVLLTESDVPRRSENTAVSGEEPLFLLGLRALEGAHASAAIECFDAAQQKGVDSVILAAHRAAAYFLLGDLQALRETYQRHPEILISPRYGASCGFWLGAEC